MSQHFAAEYYYECAETSDSDYAPTSSSKHVLPDNAPATITRPAPALDASDEEREACRALKGSMLRQEV